jgi:multiple sugar transport system substrate-binding protein
MADNANEERSSQGSISVSGGQQEPIFENVVAKKFPQIANVMEEPSVPEEVPPDVSSPQEVLRPAQEVLSNIPEIPRDSGNQKYIFIGAVSVFFVIVFAILFFTFRSRTPAAPVVTPVTLTYWGLWEDEQVLRPVFDRYKNQHPHVTIRYEKMSPQQYITLLKGRSPNGKGPDIFRYHNTWLPQLTDIAAPMPSSIMTTADFKESFYPIIAQDLIRDENIYGLPTYLDALVLLYNKKILSAAGYAGPPRSWIIDFPDVISEITVVDSTGKITTSAIAIGTTANVEHFSDILGTLFLIAYPAKSETLTNKDGLAILRNLTRADGASALQIMRGVNELGIWNESMPNSIDAFAAERVAMIFAPTWQIPNIRAKNPDLDFGVAPIPEGPGQEQGVRRATVASYWVEGVSKYSRNQVEAWKFLKFMSQPESLEKIFEMQVKLRGMGMLYPRPAMSKKVADDPVLSVLIAQSDAMVSLPLISRTYDEGLNDEIIRYLENAINAKSEQYDGSISTASRGINEVLEKYKIE